MNLRTVYHTAIVLIISQLRVTRRGIGRLNFLRRPLIILIIDVAAFITAFILMLTVGSIFAESQLSVQIIIELPLFLVFLVMLSGLLWEINHSFTFTSSDLINHLPISAQEYVLASSIAIVFSYSLFLAAGLGGTLSLALSRGLISMWLMMTMLSIVAMFIGAFGIEALGSVMNRASSLLYRRSGKPVLALRMILLIATLVCFQLIFNPRLLIFILERTAGGVRDAYFIPLVWPSLALFNLIDGQILLMAVYIFFTFFFAVFLFLVSVRLRWIYWVPMPVTVKLSTKKYIPHTGFLGRLGLNPTESALVRKDFKSLTRRREMARYLSVPVLLVISIILSSTLSSAEGGSSTSSIMFWVFPLLFGLGLFALLNSMISVGQEGRAIWVIYSTPVSAREFIKAKLSANLILSIPLAFLFWLGIILLANSSLKIMMALIITLSGLGLVESLLGLLVGIRFPDFSESLRSRFIRIQGMLLGMLAGVIIAGIIVLPFALYLIIKTPVLEDWMFFTMVSIISLALIVVISVVTYRLCILNAKRFFQEIPL